ncbi:hypothetical protein ABPG74_007821 [Tetrahymena malaccensis]
MKTATLLVLTIIALVLGTVAIYQIAKPKQNLNYMAKCLAMDQEVNSEGVTLFYARNYCDQPYLFSLAMTKDDGEGKNYTIDVPCLQSQQQYLLKDFKLSEFFYDSLSARC